MKKAEDLLSYLLDEKTLTKAQEYSSLSSSWHDIVSKYKIAAAADHARIVELERHVLLIETDHPGWIQVLQTKQRELLHEFQRRFPDFIISGISFRLSRKPLPASHDSAPDSEAPAEPDPAELEELEEAAIEEEKYEQYEQMDDNFKKTLKRLERHIVLRDKTRNK